MTDLIPSEGGGDLRPAASTEVSAQRATAEVQASMTIAKRFPRDETAALARIIKSCSRKSFVMRPDGKPRAMFAYPRGDATVTGPSIRTLEVIAQQWGNMQSGWIELERHTGVSQVMAYAWDLETNYRETKTFSVAHIIDTKNGPKHLRDERDIYEHVANMAARRKRSCIESVIPRDILDQAVAQIYRTMRGDGSEPLSDRIRKMAVTFLNSFGVTQEQLETRLGHRLDATTEPELADMLAAWNSIRDGDANVEEWFPREQPPAEADASGPSKSDALAAELQAKGDQPATDDGGPTESDQGTWPPDKRTKRGKAVAIWLERIGKVPASDMQARFALLDEIGEDGALEPNDKDELARVTREGVL